MRCCAQSGVTAGVSHPLVERESDLQLTMREHSESAAGGGDTGGGCVDGGAIGIDRCQLGSGRGGHNLTPLHIRAHNEPQRAAASFLPKVNVLDGVQCARLQLTCMREPQLFHSIQPFMRAFLR